MIPLCFGNVIELIIYLNNYEIHPDTTLSPPHPTVINPNIDSSPTEFLHPTPLPPDAKKYRMQYLKHYSIKFQ